MKLLNPEWRSVWKHWSTQLIGLGLIVLAWPEFFLSLYSMLPSDIQDILPGRIHVVISCMVLALLAKIINQKVKKTNGHRNRKSVKQNRPKRVIRKRSPGRRLPRNARNPRGL